MLNAIIILIVLYLVFRFLTTWFIPRMTQRSIKRYQEKFRRDNPSAFKREKLEANQNPTTSKEDKNQDTIPQK